MLTWRNLALSALFLTVSSSRSLTNHYFFSVTIPQFSLFLNFRYFSISVTFINFLSNFQIGFYFHFQIELTFSDWIFLSPVLYRTGHFSIMVISFDLCLQVYFHFLIGLFFQFLNFLIGIILPIRKETFFHFLFGISFSILFYNSILFLIILFILSFAISLTVYNRISSDILLLQFNSFSCNTEIILNLKMFWVCAES